MSTFPFPFFHQKQDAHDAGEELAYQPRGMDRLISNHLLDAAAMIPANARHRSQLIALLLDTHFVLLPDGFAESEADYHQDSAAAGGKSAKPFPQGCGKAPAIFNVAGLSSWLLKRFPRATAVHVEAETGISAASVENWLQGRSQPSVESFSILLLNFGPALLRASLRDTAEWLERADNDQQAAEIDEAIAALQIRRQALAQGK